MSPLAFRLPLASALLLAASTLTAQASEEVDVQLDQAKIFRVAAPAGTIIIGNPGIADATMQDPQTLIITGRGYGQTNMIVLDEQGETISDTQIMVTEAVDNYVTVYKGALRQSLTCHPICQAAVVPGDDSGHFGGAISQSGAHSSLGASSQTTSAVATAAPSQDQQGQPPKIDH
ncbi:pilus assembly protein N-terminal domain-containing protein [Oryzibacter oryziterrae]|uniref:pilus assembly protein N-terminal domain-containing protein n=1 Tax=Oryzibacter oryziterrae TaxID=2766474 RepID=UPI001F43DFB6|nr:pilus assembly protein N-terminal domain-containing protein [Oryzibacter oryziterrae]